MPPVTRQVVDAAEFRNVLRCLPTPVTVVAARGRLGPVGLVVGSFVSISLTPPLVGFFISDHSSSWPEVERTGSFTVSVLAHDQNDVCRQLATPGGNKFRAIPWASSPSGHPIIAGCVAWFDCDIERTETIGDHRLVVATVSSLAAKEDRRSMVFLRGTFAI